MSKKEFCKKHGLSEAQFTGEDRIGGSLDLRSLTSIPEGFNPTVGGSLDLTSLTSIPEGFNPTVGGSLYLNSLTSIPEGFNPTVGGSLYLNSLTSKEKAKVKFRCLPDDFFFTWENGKYIQVDGIFSEVVSRRGNILKVKFIGEKKVTYLITDGQGRWAHGENLKEAREDLVYKIRDRNASKYTGLTLDSRLSFKKAIEAYRVITGACAAGTRMFVENLPLIKKSYKISEIVELTRGAYGNRGFESFFVK